MDGGTTRTARAVAAVALATFAVALLALDARATYGARTTADEPQYLLTALSLAEDLDLDISDELAARAYLPFHEITLDTQTIDLNDDGQRLSPHDPLLPLLLAAPMGLGGWAGAKVALAAVGALTAAATTLVAIRRFEVTPVVAALVVGGLFVSPPLTAYATQVYPEMPAAGLVVVAVGSILSSELRRRHVGVAFAAIVLLPWLSVKYVPVAAVLGLWLLARTPRARRPMLVVGAVLAGAGYLVIHQRVYGGWTVYAAGDHFVDGEFRVVGDDPDYLGRSRRLIGLVVDRGFGLAAWAPAWLALAPALGWLGARRPRGWGLLTAAIAAGWATATWVALTMHGWWWPGRQLVMVLPLAAVVVAILFDRARRWLPWFVVATCVSVGSWLWLVIEASTDRRTLITDFEQTTGPWYRMWRQALPDHRRFDAVDVALTAAWVVALGALTAVAVRSARRADAVPDSAEHEARVLVDA